MFRWIKSLLHTQPLPEEEISRYLDSRKCKGCKTVCIPTFKSALNGKLCYHCPLCGTLLNRFPRRYPKSKLIFMDSMHTPASKRA